MSIIYTLLASVTTPTTIPKVAADQTQIGNVVTAIFGLAAAVCVVFVVVGAIQYMLALGDSSSIKKSKDAIFYALYGLIFVVIAFFIVQFVIGVFK